MQIMCYTETGKLTRKFEIPFLFFSCSLDFQMDPVHLTFWWIILRKTWSKLFSLILRSSIVLANICADSLLDPSGRKIFLPVLLLNKPRTLFLSSFGCMMMNQRDPSFSIVGIPVIWPYKYSHSLLQPPITVLLTV